MPRLLRPHIPIETRCRVVLRQLGEMWTSDVLRVWQGHFGSLLADRLAKLAALLHCEVKDLHLDHDPALAAREKVFKKGEHVGYRPDANDPEHLYYREAAAHRVKTNVRGLHGQHPDRVLIKKQRRREKNRAASTVPPRKPSYVNRRAPFAGKPKAKLASRPLKSASRWPKNRKVNWRKKR